MPTSGKKKSKELPSDLVIILSIVLAVIVILLVYMKRQGELKEDEYTLWEEENGDKEVAPPCLRIECTEKNQETRLKYYFSNAEKLARYFE